MISFFPDTAGMFNAMKRDLSNFRFEMVKTLHRQDKDRNKLREELHGLDDKLQTARDELKDVTSACQTLETLLTDEIRQGVCDGNVKLTNVDENVVSVRGDVSSHESNVNQKLRSLESKVLDSIAKFDPIMASLSDVQNRLRRLANERDDAGTGRVGYQSYQSQRTSLVSASARAAAPAPAPAPATAATAVETRPSQSSSSVESTTRKSPAVASSTETERSGGSGDTENAEPVAIHGVKLKKVRPLPDNWREESMLSLTVSCIDRLSEPALFKH